MFKSKRQLAKAPNETLPVKLLPPSTTGRAGTATFFYMGVMSLMPTVLVGMEFRFFPLVPVMALPFATAYACQLATSRKAAYEDVPPALAAFNQSLVIWLGIMLSFPVFFAFDVAPTIVPQLVAGGFLAALGPGVAAQWADLPRQVYFPVQPSPHSPRPPRETRVAGTEISSLEEVLEKQIRHYKRQKSNSPSALEDLTREDYESF